MTGGLRGTVLSTAFEGVSEKHEHVGEGHSRLGCLQYGCVYVGTEGLQKCLKIWSFCL